VRVQTFFGPPHRRYFVVEASARAQRDAGAEAAADRRLAGVDEAARALLEAGERLDAAEAREAARADDEQRPSDNSPWL
jgi:hypothetical protein